MGRVNRVSGYTASSTNVAFAFELALDAARDLHSLAGEVRSSQDDRTAASRRAVVDWRGPHRDHFDSLLSTEGADAATVADGLVTLANLFASTWAQARGEQDRINFARYVEHDKSQDSWLEDTGEFFAGETDYGSPPGDPPVPAAPDYAATRAPIHPEFE
jgi:hypothetical protein